ncbi:GntR family transcriptional regulator [Pseudaminobacter arsenicus]|uniref:GntR family transcriptional regulator n=1 Tax=Borborobacter arsenicus TaxID=1851146 RepID=A0A432V3A5_9HYPH|nr:GntR family transcriptional regulator [Pseudaminobacter arsenicus]RUM96636.1 GntR family transcriptional regulator [Pseudaminobacter arsenicus]
MSESTQAQIAYEQLRADLLACRLVPGERIRMNEAVNRLDVNLGAVREALSRLAAEGLVIATQQRGFRAAPISVQDLKDLTPVRIEIEISCLRRSLRNGDLSWETHLVAAFHKVSKTPIFDEGNPKRASETFASAHDEFHGALVAACDNSWLLRIRDTLYTQWERYRRLAVQLPRTERDLNAEHRELFNAAMERDENKIASLISDHFNKTTEILLSATDFLDIKNDCSS